VILSTVPLMISEDVGNYFAQVPGALIWLGVAGAGGEHPGLHSPYFQLDPEALLYGTALHINNVIAFNSGTEPRSQESE
jgi:metal-dependent amidase/aminoacylase/carboxypeptidase family protein